MPLAEARRILEEKRFRAQGVTLARTRLVAHPDAEDGRVPGTRVTFLSPFDGLVKNRDRAEALWDFFYRLEMYVPKAKREYGYYVLPILRGDRLIGRIEPAFDRKTGVLHVHGVFAEPGAPAGAGRGVASATRRLAKWLGATDIVYSRKVPTIWRTALRVMELDHVLIAVSDLEAAARRSSSATGSPRSKAAGTRGSGPRTRSFRSASTYLELVAVVDEAEAAQSGFGSWVAAGDLPRLLGWCVRTDDLDSVAGRLDLTIADGARLALTEPCCAGEWRASSAPRRSPRCRSSSSGDTTRRTRARRSRSRRRSTSCGSRAILS